MHSYIRISLSMWFTLVVVGGITCFAYQKADLHNLSVCVCVYVGGRILTTVIVVYKVLQRTDHRCRVECPTCTCIHTVYTVYCVCIHTVHAFLNHLSGCLLCVFVLYVLCS